MPTYNPYHLKNFYNQIMKTNPLLYKYQFVIEFIQGGTMGDGYGGTQSFTLFDNASNPDENFTYYAQSGSIPKFTIQKASIPFYATDFRTPTVIQYNHDWIVKILLEQDMIMYEKLRAWMKLMTSLENSGGGIKTIPNINMRISLMNSEHTHFTSSYVMTGIWPVEIPQISLKYENTSTQPLAIDCKFKYQYCYRDDNFDLSQDPLGVKNHYKG